MNSEHDLNICKREIQIAVSMNKLWCPPISLMSHKSNKGIGLALGLELLDLWEESLLVHVHAPEVLALETHFGRLGSACSEAFVKELFLSTNLTSGQNEVADWL